jgi:hypothetical protein
MALRDRWTVAHYSDLATTGARCWHDVVINQ